MMRPLPVVAIDGPAGAGKSTVTLQVAEALNYLVLDTGAIYRSVALAARQAGIDWNDGSGVSEVAADLAKRTAIEFRPTKSGVSSGSTLRQAVWLNGKDVSLEIRTPELSDGASRVSSIPKVREALFDLQRRVGHSGGVVVEGRDIGSVVFPDAEAKFFLTASVEVRAQRRLEELIARGISTDFATVAAEVRNRDERDRNRAIAPLLQAKDAHLVDSSNMSIAQVVSTIVSRVQSVALAMMSKP
jgi:CMP/dCMP kinase